MEHSDAKSLERQYFFHTHCRLPCCFVSQRCFLWCPPHCEGSNRLEKLPESIGELSLLQERSIVAQQYFENSFSWIFGFQLVASVDCRDRSSTSPTMNWADYLRVFASWISQSRWHGGMNHMNGKPNTETDTRFFLQDFVEGFEKSLHEYFHEPATKHICQPQLRNTSNESEWICTFLSVYMSTRIQRWASELFTAAAQTSFVAVPSPAQGWRSGGCARNFPNPQPSPRWHTPSTSLLLAHAPAKLQDVCTHPLHLGPSPAHVPCANFLFLKRTPTDNLFCEVPIAHLPFSVFLLLLEHQLFLIATVSFQIFSNGPMAHPANSQVVPTANGSIGQQPLDGVAGGIGTSPGAWQSVDMAF